MVDAYQDVKDKFMDVHMRRNLIPHFFIIGSEKHISLLLAIFGTQASHVKKAGQSCRLQIGYKHGVP